MKVGDKVKLIKGVGGPPIGAVGVIICLDGDLLGVKFEGWNNGHSVWLDGSRPILKDGDSSGWWVAEDDLEPA